MKRINKTKLIQVRLKESEYELVLQEMQRRELRTVSAYVRMCVLNPLHNSNDHYRRELRRLSFQLGKISNHMIQMNRSMETGTGEQDYILQAEPLKELDETLKEVVSILVQIKESRKEMIMDGDHEAATSETV